MYVAVMGYGTVGSGVVEVLTKNHDSIVKRSTQNEMEVKYILDLRDFPGDPHESKMIKDFNIILNDDDVKIVVETMGGLHPAYEFVSSCLKAGKSVVTSNKELVAAKGCELLQFAAENNVNFLFAFTKDFRGSTLLIENFEAVYSFCLYISCLWTFGPG